MSTRRVWLLILIALALRLFLQAWDSSLLSPHPDERQVAFVAEKTATWFADPGFYAYGSLHFHAVRLATRVLNLPSTYAGLLLGGRGLSLLASMVALLLGWWVASEAWGRRTADLALLLGAFVPLDLQLSHFATVEAHHAVWVMACIAACFWLGRRPGMGAAAAVGVTWGASLAVKVSSLSLALVVVVALVAVLRSHGWARALASALVAGTTLVLSFALCQPSALAAAWPPLAEPYLRGVAEQINMVTGRSDLPYVRTYHRTIKFLYPARELTMWALGPALAVASLSGALAALVALGARFRRHPHRPFNDSSLLTALVLAWLLPMSLRLATLDVKFLRYWQPLVVPLVLVAAWALVRLPAGLRRRTTQVVVAGTVVWGVAFVIGFASSHPHRVAAEWLVPMIEQDQVVAVEHWDETLPLGAATVSLPSYDLPDDLEKARGWCERLAEADWVVLSSHRVRRTVWENHHRFPITGRLYALLLAGELGFEPLAQASRAPRVLGLELPVQRADESFVNYDFPRVVVLRRVAEVEPEQILARVVQPMPEVDGVGATELDRRLVDGLPRIPAVVTARAQMVDLALWLLLFTALGIATWCLLAPLLRTWADGGFGLALATGWLAPAWLMWIGCELGLWPAGRTTASWIALLAVAFGAAVGWRRRWRLRRVWRLRRRSIRLVVAATLAVGLLFLVVRLFNPAVHWGEKPMDFSFLNSFVAAETWPPGEPWMAGKPLGYYYFGEVLSAFPILVTGAAPAVGYNLAVSTIPAISAALLASLGLSMARRRRQAFGLLIPGLVLLTGNLAWPFLIDLLRDRRWFDLWWATSRVIPGFAIDEYPLWTAIFADLHAHFVALPVLIATLLWGWTTVELRRGPWLLAAGLCGLSAAVLAATNPWDILMLTAILTIGCLAAGRNRLAGLGRLAVAAGLSVAAALPFLFELRSWVGQSQGGTFLFTNSGDFAPWWAVIRHLGLFLLPLAVLALCRAGRNLLIAIPMAAAGVAGGLALHSGAAAVALGLAGLFLTLVGRADDRPERLLWALAGLGMLAVAFCERFTLMDRMNTIFKIYNGVWLLLAVALGLAILRSTGWQRRVVLTVWLPLQLVAVMNLPLGIAQGWLQPRAESPVPTLDGQAFLAERDPQTWFLARALKGMAGPGQVVAEAAGDPYRDFTRISMHTGVTTVVGWEHHLYQRANPRAEIRERFIDLDSLYVGREPWPRRRILDRYGVDWVVVAGTERRAYKVPGEAELGQIPGVVRIAASHRAALYKVMPLTERPEPDPPPSGVTVVQPTREPAP